MRSSNEFQFQVFELINIVYDLFLFFFTFLKMFINMVVDVVSLHLKSYGPIFQFKLVPFIGI